MEPRTPHTKILGIAFCGTEHFWRYTATFCKPALYLANGNAGL